MSTAALLLIAALLVLLAFCLPSSADANLHVPQPRPDMLGRAAQTVRSNSAVLRLAFFWYDSQTVPLPTGNRQKSTLDVGPWTVDLVAATTKTYDNLNRLTEIRSDTPSLSTVNRHLYTYSAANQRTQRTDADGSYWQYGYDSLGQVTNATRHWLGGTPVTGQQYGYAFDDIGNRQRSEVSGQRSDYAANILNQYESRTVPGIVNVMGLATNAATVSVGNVRATRQGDYFHASLAVSNSLVPVHTNLVTTGVLKNAGANGADIVATKTGTVFVAQSPEQFTHDADGNVTSDGRWQYTWDAENRLIAVETLTNLSASVPRQRLEFAYDASFRRVAKKVYAWNAGAWQLTTDLRFVYDGWNLLAEVGTTGSVVRSYVWGLDFSGSQAGAGGVGGLLAINLGTEGTHVAVSDGSGNVVALVGADSGLPTAIYEYGPFGETIRATGPAAAGNHFRYSTKHTDIETGLVTYSPSLGCWLAPDPSGEAGGLNLYGFVVNDPLGLIDPFGLSGTSLMVVQTADGPQVVMLETAGETDSAVGRPAYAVLLERRPDTLEWSAIGYNSDANALAPMRGALESTGRNIYLGSVSENGALTIYHQGRALTTTEYAWMFSGVLVPGPTWVAAMCLASKHVAEDPTSGRNWAMAGIMIAVRPKGMSPAARSASLSANRTLRLPATDTTLAGTRTLGYTTPNGNVFLQPGLSRAEQLATLRHESVHAFLSARGNGPVATFRQNVGVGAYRNSQLLRFTEEAIAETYGSGSLLQGLRHPFVNGYVTPGGVLMEGGGLIGVGYLGYQIGIGN